jgi:hypothetical protein
MRQGALGLTDVEEEAANWCRQRAVAQPIRPQITQDSHFPKRAHATTLSDLLANRWQTAIWSPPVIQQAGLWIRPELLVCGGAPRRNRTGDPILTMNLALTAVRTSVSAAHAEP